MRAETSSYYIAARFEFSARISVTGLEDKALSVTLRQGGHMYVGGRSYINIQSHAPFSSVSTSGHVSRQCCVYTHVAYC